MKSDSMAKRKSTSGVAEEPLRRSTRQKTSATGPPATEKSLPAKAKGEKVNAATSAEKSLSSTASKTVSPSSLGPMVIAKHVNSLAKPQNKRQRAVKDTQPAEQDAENEGSKRAHETQGGAADEGRQYWLMKAEPETRLEGGVDVKFSIDDLAAKASLLQSTSTDNAC